MSVGDGAAHLAIDGTSSVGLSWRTPDGKTAKSLSVAMRDAKDEIRAVRSRVKAIEADLSLIPWRIRRLWLDNRRWNTEAWRWRYAEHPLTGAISRRLIWTLHRGDQHIPGI